MNDRHLEPIILRNGGEDLTSLFISAKQHAAYGGKIWADATNGGSQYGATGRSQEIANTTSHTSTTPLQQECSSALAYDRVT